MKEPVFFTAGQTSALRFAEAALRRKDLRFCQYPDHRVTHLLLGVPSFESDGTLKGGGHLEPLLERLSPDVRIYGGMLKHPALENYQTVDLLEDPLYVAENAQITAHCAVSMVMEQLPITLQHCPVLVIGWGRIGKCLAKLLKAMGASVSVAARKEQDRAMLLALEYDALDTRTLGNSLARFRVILNTAPELVLTKEDTAQCAAPCLKIELASLPGIDAPDVIRANGLPNKNAPQTSGELIARTILRLLY